MEQPSEQIKAEVVQPRETQKPTLPSAREREAYISEHAKTKKRIEEGKKSLSGCETLLKLFPDGTLKKEAEKRYEEAKRILDKATKDLQAIVPEVTRIATKIAEVVKNANVLVNERFRKLEALGIPREIAQNYLADKSHRSETYGVDGMINFLTEAITEFGVHHEDAFSIWSQLELTGRRASPIGIIKSMWAIGIRDNFCAIYELSRKGATDQEKRDMARALDSGNISRKEIIDFTHPFNGEGINVKETIELVGQMRKAGMSDHFYDAWEIAGRSSSKEKVDYSRINELLPLREFLDNGSIHIIHKYMKGDGKDVRNFVMTFLNDPVLREECKHYAVLMVGMYDIDKNPKKTLEYLHVLVERGVVGRDLSDVAVPLYRIVMGDETLSVELGGKTLPPMEIVKHILAIGRKLEAKGIGRKYAILLASVSGYWIKMNVSDDEIAKEILEFKSGVQIDDENTLAILGKLSYDSAVGAKELYAPKRSLFNQDAGSALVTIQSLRNKGINNDDVIEVMTYSHDSVVAMHIVDFFKTFPTIKQKAKAYSATGNGEYSSVGLVDAVKAYYEKPAEIEPLVRHLLQRQDSGIPYLNLRDFINDPTLPLCMEIYKVLKEKDPETALRIGRSLSAQGMMTIPDIATLNAKIQEWRELQASVNQIKILEGRNVVVLSNGERWNQNGDGYKKGDLRFNSDDRRKNFMESVGPDGAIDFFAPSTEKPRVEELQNVKNKTLEKIATTAPPMTFFFNGHGAPDGLYMNNGQVVGNRPVGSDLDRISSKELAGAISKRKEKFSSGALSRDIYIYSSCMSHNFIRNVYAEIKSLGGVAPISIGESEYGQYGFSDEQKYDMMYQLGVQGTTIEHLRKNEGKYLSSNFTIYVPNKEGIPQQISKTDKNSGSV